MQGVLAMLQRKAERHATAWARYQSERQQASRDHNKSAATAATQCKIQLQAISDSSDADMAVLADDTVMVLDEQQLQAVSRHCSDRKAFGQLLDSSARNQLDVSDSTPCMVPCE